MFWLINLLSIKRKYCRGVRLNTVVCKIVHKFASVWCKTALGEVGVSLSWWCAALVLLAPGYWSLLLNSKKLFVMEKWPEVIFPLVKVETLKFQQFYLVKFKVSTLTYGKMTRGHFSIINNFFKFKKRLQ